MHDSKLMQVLDAKADLVGQILCPLLRQLEPAFLDIVEHILALHVLKHNEVGVTVFEEVDQLDDVVVLAHLEYLNLTSLLEDLNRLHVRLFHCLDGGLCVSDLVRGVLDLAELTLAQGFSQFIEVKQVLIAHRLEQH